MTDEDEDPMLCTNFEEFLSNAPSPMGINFEELDAEELVELFDLLEENEDDESRSIPSLMNGNIVQLPRSGYRIICNWLPYSLLKVPRLLMSAIPAIHHPLVQSAIFPGPGVHPPILRPQHGT